MTFHRFLVALLLSALASVVEANPSDEAAIRQLQDRIAQAWIGGDAAFLDDAFDARYIHTNTRGLVTDREFDLDGCGSATRVSTPIAMPMCR